MLCSKYIVKLQGKAKDQRFKSHMYSLIENGYISTLSKSNSTDSLGIQFNGNQAISATVDSYICKMRVLSEPSKNHKPLGRSKLFSMAIGIPVALALIIFLIILFNENLNLCFSSWCFDNFYQIFKFPLSVISIAIPLTALVAAVHRSNETSIQIKSTSIQLSESLRQNSYNNLIKHKEEFAKITAEWAQKGNYFIPRPYELYSKIFQENNFDKFSPFAIKVSSDDLILRAAILVNETAGSVSGLTYLSVEDGYRFYSTTKMLNELLCMAPIEDYSKNITEINPAWEGRENIVIIWDEKYKERSGIHAAYNLINNIVAYSKYPFFFLDYPFEYGDHDKSMELLRAHADGNFPDSKDSNML